ncbi:transcription factor IIIB 90 kDa subunit [Musca domestica]|uniref:B-related factor 1 n=1 Tax=Musca domestica TaxID=7370 RepID=A0ABM3V2N1_MUSDO|nr:transcription factor IIIB 90 kDa subunit [Musca domestica]
MSSGVKCRNCGSTDIEEDNARGDRVCTNCGSVLEDSLIVSEIQFEEVGHGSSAIGQFVSAESSGGATNYGYGKFQVGSGTESREVTLKKAKREITHLCQQLQLTQHYIDTALNFFKMALMRHLTRGRKSTHIYAACVYITCRTEGTSHLLIDISDVQQICSYELGRTYLKLSNALCINIPSVDPCLYIMRFANKLQFGAKAHEVSMTALRIVQRMKKDSIHSGRRPTGLCGAALLIAARMHEFNRTIVDIVRIVKIHESTLRKRLTEFADTPSSALTLDEFMSVDLEAEQDPPAFKAARKKDRERIKEIGESELTELQKEIDLQLEQDLKRAQKSALKRLTFGKDDFEEEETAEFIEKSNLEAIEECLADNPDLSEAAPKTKKLVIEGLKPDIESMCQPTASELQELEKAQSQKDDIGELSLEGLDDEEINNYILTHEEAERKNIMWKALNAEYLKEMKEKEERLAKEREEGKPEKKKRKSRKKIIGPSTTAGEAIEKMLQEKKISTKINYDILKTLTEGGASSSNNASSSDNAPTSSGIIKQEVKDIKPKVDVIIESGPIHTKHGRGKPSYSIGGPSAKIPKLEMGLPVGEPEPKEDAVVVENDDIEDDDAVAEDEVEPEPEKEYSSLKDMLNDGNDDDDYYGYDEDNY